MRTFYFLVIQVLAVMACQQKKGGKAEDAAAVSSIKKPVDSLLLTDSSWGGIYDSTDIDGLTRLYGEANIKDERICGPECIDSFDVTMVYPGSSREFVVYWEDSAYHQKIGFIRCYAAGAPYHSALGIKMGLSLRELLRINGKPIAFLGFGWDYGGSVISLNHGVLEETNVRFNLSLDDAAVDKSVIGDTELNSEMPSVQKLLDRITVSELFLPFNKR